MKLQLSIRPALVLALATTMLGGCAEVHRGYQSIAEVGASPRSVDEPDAVLPITKPDVKTVRPLGAPRAATSGTSETSEAEPATTPTVVASAVPSPRQIFDFHPAGSASGGFRQPFVIDMNDGPLTADVRKTAAELKAFKAGLDVRTVGTGPKPCSETEVALKKTGCTTPARRAAAASSQKATAIQ